MRIKNVIYLAGLVSVLHFPVFAMEEKNNDDFCSKFNQLNLNHNSQKQKHSEYVSIYKQSDQKHTNKQTLTQNINNIVNVDLNQINKNNTHALPQFKKAVGTSPGLYLKVLEGDFKVCRDDQNSRLFYISQDGGQSRVYTQKTSGGYAISTDLNGKTHYFNSFQAFWAVKNDTMNQPISIFDGFSFPVNTDSNGSYILYKNEKVYVQSQGSQWHIPWGENRSSGYFNGYFTSPDKMLEYKSTQTKRDNLQDVLDELETRSKVFNLGDTLPVGNDNSVIQDIQKTQNNVTANQLQPDPDTSIPKRKLNALVYKEYVALLSLPKGKVYDSNDQGLNDEMRKNQKLALLVTEQTPFAEGDMRTACRGYLYSTKGKDGEVDTSIPPEEVVIKFYKKNNDLQYHLSDQFIYQKTQEFAEEFDKMYGSFLPTKVSVPNTSVVIIVKSSDPKRVKKTGFIEPYIDGEYKKYSNNYGFVAGLHNCEMGRNTPQAFSHFTYKYAKEYLKEEMIAVDIQGVKDIYTDPQIHHRTDLIHYGRGNLGQKGIRKFFKTHTCNSLCELMGINIEKDEFGHVIPSSLDKKLNNLEKAKEAQKRILDEQPRILQKKIDAANKEIEDLNQQLNDLAKDNLFSFNN